MELIEFKEDILEHLKEKGYQYVLHTKPSRGDVALDACEELLVKFIPLKTKEEAEKFLVEDPAAFLINLEDMPQELHQYQEKDLCVKFYVEEKYIKIS